MGQRLLQLLCVTAATIAGACPAQSPDLRSKINDALDMARPALVAHLKAATKGATRTGELALLVLAAIHDGVLVTDKPLAKAIKKLAKSKPRQTYDIALRLLVLEACPTFPDRLAIAKKDAKLLLSHRSDEGAFQYQRRPAAWDLSNTQYGALGLRAASAMGIKIRRDVWKKLAREIGDQQASDGGFSYSRRRRSGSPYPSMTAAGIAVLAVCRQALGDNYTRSKDIDKQINRAWVWMEDHVDAIGSTKERWSFYFHYGLERAAILCDIDKIGGVTDWYAQGAQMFVDEQLNGGGWSSHTDGFPGHHLAGKKGDVVPTSFAVLFLRRKFQKLVGPITQRIVRLVNIGPKSKQKDIDECSKQMLARGKAAMADVIKALCSEIETQRRVGAQVLEGLAGERFGFDPVAAREANRAAVRRAELWYLKNR